MSALAAIPSLFSAGTAAAGAAGAAGSLSTLSTILTVGGQVVQTAGAMSQAKQEARMANENIQAIQRRKQDEKKRLLRGNLKRQGAARANMAAAGIDLSSDSPLLVLDEIITIGEEDISAVETNAAADIRQQQLKQKAAISKGRNALLGGAIGIGGTLLSSRKKKQTAKM